MDVACISLYDSLELEPTFYLDGISVLLRGDALFGNATAAAQLVAAPPPPSKGDTCGTGCILGIVFHLI